MKSFFAPALLAASAASTQLTFSYEGEITATDQNGGSYSDRTMTFVTESVFGLHYTAWTSTNVDSDTSMTSADLIAGFTMASQFILPQAYLASYSGTATVSTSGNAYTADVTGAGSFIGVVYASLREYNPNTQAYVGNAIPLSNFVYTSSGDQTAESTLHYVTYTGAHTGSNMEFGLTTVVSETPGIVNGALMTPEQLEGFITIDDFPYTETTNQVELTMHVAATAANFAGTADLTVTDGTLVVGTGEDAVYFHLAGTAEVDGSSVSVEIDAMVEADATDIAGTIVAAVEGAFESSHSVDSALYTSKVKFPAGATSIVYDPTVGRNPPSTVKDPNSSSMISASFAVVGVSALFALVTMFL